MRKNGFTLVEMLTVIVILVTLGLIAVFSISKIVKDSSEQLYDMQITSVIDASRTYAIERSDQLSDYNQITLCDLKINGLLEEDFVNPKNEEKFDDSLIIEINKNASGDYDIKFDAITKMAGYYCDLNAISVKLLGNSPYYVSYGSNYADPGITVEKENASGVMVNYENYTLSKSGNYEDAIESGVFKSIGTYSETYTVTDKATNFKTSVTRTIVVEDNTAPVITLNVSSNPIILLEGETLTYPSCSVSDNLDTGLSCKMQDNYKNNTTPGTYEIVYTAQDLSGNTNTKVLNITVRAKNKKLLGKLTMDTLSWTNTGVNIEIDALYNDSSCNSYLYTFDSGYNWGTANTKSITENGIHKFGIKYNTSVCTNIEENIDTFTYKFSNIDIEPPTFLVKNPSTNEYENKSSLLVASVSGESIYTETKNETLDGEVIEHKYYYAKDSVNISGASGAFDSLSGISHYTIFVDDVEQVSTDFTLDTAGKYILKMKATDHAGNESDLIEVATIIIDKEAPTCSFVTCANTTQCNNNPAIYGANVTYVPAKASFQVALDSNEYQFVNYKLICTDTYPESEDDYLASVNIPLENFRIQNEYGSNLSTVVSHELTNTSVSCTSGICTRNYNYLVGVNVGKADTYNDDPIILEITGGAVTDKAGNSSMGSSLSMYLAKKR